MMHRDSWFYQEQWCKVKQYIKKGKEKGDARKQCLGLVTAKEIQHLTGKKPSEKSAFIKSDDEIWRNNNFLEISDLYISRINI